MASENYNKKQNVHVYLDSIQNEESNSIEEQEMSPIFSPKLDKSIKMRKANKNN